MWSFMAQVLFSEVKPDFIRRPVNYWVIRIHVGSLYVLLHTSPCHQHSSRITVYSITHLCMCPAILLCSLPLLTLLLQQLQGLACLLPSTLQTTFHLLKLIPTCRKSRWHLNDLFAQEVPLLSQLIKFKLHRVICRDASPRWTCQQCAVLSTKQEGWKKIFPQEIMTTTSSQML